MSKLTETQLIILSAAAQRGNGAALPVPGSLSRNKGAARTVLASLLRRGLVAERPARKTDEVWRETDDGARLALAITGDGLAAIGVDPAPSDVGRSAAAPKARRSPDGGAPTVRPGTKQAQLIGLLQRDAGATALEIGQATGWQPHSVRGAISGTLKKKLGLPVISERVDGRGCVYRIAGLG